MLGDLSLDPTEWMDDSVLVCIVCGAVVHGLRLNGYAHPILTPCGHADGYRPVPASATGDAEA